jgi:hypothetical protein
VFMFSSQQKSGIDGGNRIRRRISATAELPKSLALALLLTAGAAAQEPSLILGFETPGSWISSARVSSTTTRTQGSLALELRGPASATTLTSLPVGSTAPGLAGVANVGATFEVDVMLPAQGGSVVNMGSLKLLVNSPSKGLANVAAGQVNFTGFRPGIYNTMQFPIPDSVRSALGSGFNDLTFAFVLNVAGSAAGSYLFDNLRVHSVALVTTPDASTKPPAGYGGSVDLVATGSTPAAQFFEAGPVQVPDSFHLRIGDPSGTTVQLALGYDGIAAFTCTYDFVKLIDIASPKYGLASCTGGVQAGDLVAASWAQLTIMGGNDSMQIQAQLARNPAGDLVGGGILPPMPTFWGDFDGCVPAPVAGVTVTLSASCANKIAQANQIVTDFFNKVDSSNSPPNWIVTPTPEFARRHDNGASHNPQIAQPTRQDPPFDQEGHMNPGGAWDAYWRLSGSLDAETTPGNRNTTHFDGSFSGHAVLWGEDVSIVSINAKVDTDTGSLTVQPSATGSLQVFLFGNKLFDESGNASKGFNFDKSFDPPDLNLPPIEVWIFTIHLGATVSAKVEASGTLAATGFTMALTPSASLGAHVSGGVDIGIASGLVDARVDLLDVTTPVTTHAGWFTDTRPQYCAVTLVGSAHGDAQISSGGGKINLVASALFWDKTWTLFDWKSLASYNEALFDVSLSAALVPLPTSLCAQTLTVTITSPPASVAGGASLPLLGFARGNSTSPGCDTFKWSLSPVIPGEKGVIGAGCDATLWLDPPIPITATTSRILTLNVDAPIKDQFNRLIPQTGFTSETLTVTGLTPGLHIIGTVPDSGVPQPLEGKTIVFHFPDATASFDLKLFGTVTGSSETITDWAVTDSHGNIKDLGGGNSVIWFGVPHGTFTVTVTTRTRSVSMIVQLL